MESVTTQAKEVPKAIKGAFSKPVMALGVALAVVSVVVLIEIFYPGAITGRIRRAFGMVGITGKAA